ncbi:MAG: MFS transporter [Candidatus Heimdallarchaeota archaeon]
MIKTQRLSEEKRASAKFLLPSLAISYFATVPPAILVSLLLIDIGDTFNRSVGVTGQIQTAASLVGAISAVLVGALSVRFNYKSLLLLGLLFINITALGCAVSLNFALMLIAFSLSGLGINIVEPMLFSLVGEHFPLEKRTNAIGWVLTGVSLSSLIGAPIIGFIVSLEFGNWRLAFLMYVLPVSLLGIAMAAKGVPTPSQQPHHPIVKGKYLEGFKEIFTNRSAMMCLVGAALSIAGFQAIVLYGASYFRQRFQLSIEYVSFLFPVFSLCYIFGNQISSRVVNQYGRKLITVLSAFFAGILVISFMNVPNIWLAYLFTCLGGMLFGMLATASFSLTLEQVPRFRGTMMSLRSASTSMGAALGAGVGGLALFWWDFESVGIALGALSIAAAIIFNILVFDPTSTDSYASQS